MQATGTAAGAKRRRVCDDSVAGSSDARAPRIAIVDLSDPAAARTLADAFMDTGFAVVTQHGFPAETVSNLRRCALAFFDQSVDEKRAVDGARAGQGFGKSTYHHMEDNLAQLLGDFSKPNDLSEALQLRLGSPDLLESVPRKPAGFAEAVLAYRTGLRELQRTLMALCARGMGIQSGELNSICDMELPALRMVHYPGIEGEVLEGQMRSGAHVDTGCVTILSPDPVHGDGLQVLIDEEWVDVPLPEGAFILNIGSQFGLLTNGVWRAVQHRVVPRPGRRLTVVSGMCRIREHVVISPLPHFLGDGAKFTPILAKDFNADRIALHRPSYQQEQLVGAQTQQLAGESSAAVQSLDIREALGQKIKAQPK